MDVVVQPEDAWFRAQPSPYEVALAAGLKPGTKRYREAVEREGKRQDKERARLRRNRLAREARSRRVQSAALDAKCAAILAARVERGDTVAIRMKNRQEFEEALEAAIKDNTEFRRLLDTSIEERESGAWRKKPKTTEGPS